MVPKRKHAAFSLVETLIVMAIIGILAAVVTVNMGGSIDRAEASRVIADLDALRSAAQMYLVDNGSDVETLDIDLLKTYVTAPEKFDDDEYEFLVGDDTSQWFVGRKASTLSSAVREVLQGMATDNGLRNSVSSSETDTYDGGENGIYLRVR